MTAPTTVADGFSYLEGPRWHDGRLWLSDFYTHQVVSVDGDGGDLRVEAIVPGQPSGLGWLPDGRLLVVSMKDRRILRREADGALVVHADLSDLAGGHLNDLVVGSDGTAYVGNFGFDLMGGAPMAPAPLIRVSPDGDAELATEPLHFANGAVISGSTLIVGETFGNRISAFDIHPGGSLGPRQDWAVFGDTPDTSDLGEALALLAVGPDGMTIDREGAIWIADALGNRLLRIRRGGEVIDEISTGDLGVFATVLGGPDGDVLYLCAAPSFAEHERRDTREGRLLATRVSIGA